MVTIGELYTNLKNVLQCNNIEDYRFEASCIMEQVFGTGIEKLIINGSIPVKERELCQIEKMSKQRKLGYPLQYILGEWEFYGLTFRVGEGVLIPRADTEILVERVLNLAKGIAKPKIIDLCSGSGCIAIAIKKYLPDAEVYALEHSQNALVYLRENIILNDTAIEIIDADVLDSRISSIFRDIDIIVSNPPYLTAEDFKRLQKEVSFEPSMALNGGKNGLCFYKGIASVWKNSIKADGYIAFEIGMGQEKAVSDILEKNEFKDIIQERDLSGIIRVITAKR